METPSNDARVRRVRVVALVVIVVIAAWLRVSYVVNTVVVEPIRADARQYVVYAWNMGRHGVFSQDERPPIKPDSFRSPGYPAFLSLLMVLKEHWYRATLLVQAALGTFTVLLTYFFARTFLSHGAAWCATVMTAISPHLISMTIYVLTETLFCFLLTASLLWLVLAVKWQSRLCFVGTGVAFGLTYLVNEALLLLPLLIAIPLALGGRGGDEEAASRLRLSRSVVPFVIAFLLFPAGWMLRNSVQQIEPERSGSRRAVATISHGSYIDYIYRSPQFRYYPYDEDPEQPVYGESFSNFWPIFTRRFAERPLRYTSWYTIEKPFLYFWGWNILQGQGDVYVYNVQNSLFQTSAVAGYLRLIMRIAHPVVVLTAVLGAMGAMWMRFRSTDYGATWPPLVVAICLAYFTLLYGCVFAGWPRYAVPLRPELYLASAYGLSLAFTFVYRQLAPASNRPPSTPQSRKGKRRRATAVTQPERLAACPGSASL